MMKIHLFLVAIGITGVVSGSVVGQDDISPRQSDVSKGDVGVLSGKYDLPTGVFNQPGPIPIHQHSSSETYSGLGYLTDSEPAPSRLQTDLAPPDVAQYSLYSSDQHRSSDSKIYVEPSKIFSRVPSVKRDVSTSYLHPYSPGRNTISRADRHHITDGFSSMYDAINTYSMSSTSSVPRKIPDTNTNQKSSVSPSSSLSRLNTPLSPDYDDPNTFLEIPFSNFGQHIKLDTRKNDLGSLPNAIRATPSSDSYIGTGNRFGSALSSISQVPKVTSKFSSSRSSNYHDYPRERGSVPKITVDHTSLPSHHYTLEVLYGPNEAFHPSLVDAYSMENVFRADTQQSPLNSYPQYDVKFESSKYKGASDVSSKRNNPSYFLGEDSSSTDSSLGSSRNNYNFRNSQLEDKLSKLINYKFSYQIQDKLSGTNFGHEENRNDIGAEGSYRVALPDGRTQVVHYQAGEEGYVPTIRYEKSRQGTATARRAQASRKSSFRRTQVVHY